MSLVKDINPNGSSSPFNLTRLSDTKFVFAAVSPNNQFDLYISDGTEQGTQLASILVKNPSDITNVGNSVFFTAEDTAGARGRELYRLDSNGALTILPEFNPGPGDADIGQMIDVNGTLYLSASSLGLGRELWKSDGTPQGTILVQDIAQGPLGSDPQQMQNLVTVHPIFGLKSAKSTSIFID